MMRLLECEPFVAFGGHVQSLGSHYRSGVGRGQQGADLAGDVTSVEPGGMLGAEDLFSVLVNVLDPGIFCLLGGYDASVAVVADIDHAVSHPVH